MLISFFIVSTVLIWPKFFVKSNICHKNISIQFIISKTYFLEVYCSEFCVPVSDHCCLCWFDLPVVGFFFQFRLLIKKHNVKLHENSIWYSFFLTFLPWAFINLQYKEQRQHRKLCNCWVFIHARTNMKLLIKKLIF